jgi:hypothetical protein
VRTRASLDAPVAPGVLFPYVADLDRYEAWMPLVHRATPVGDGEWDVELRARLGPVARSKRLRMVRTWLEWDRAVVFERREPGDRRSSPWVLRADLRPVEGGTHLEMDLSYGGALWTGGMLQRVLDEQIRQGSERLLALVSPSP